MERILLNQERGQVQFADGFCFEKENRKEIALNRWQLGNNALSNLKKNSICGS